MKLCWTTLIIVFFSMGVYAQKFSNEFLSIGAGARAQGLGGANVATVSDATSGFWNPAGLMGVEGDLQVSAMHAEWFGGIGKYDYFTFAAPINDRKRVLGFSFIRFGIDNIPNTLTLYEDDGTINYSNLSSFSAVDYAFLFSYAQKVGQKLRIGGNVKLVHRKIGPFANAWGFGVDLGAQYRTGDFRFGILGKDLTSTFNAWSFNFTEDEQQTLQQTGNEIPESSIEITRPQLILGGGWQKDFVLGVSNKEDADGFKKNRTFGVLAELNLVATTDGQRNVLISADPISIDPAFGLEVNYNKLIFLRGGINNFQQVSDLLGNQSWQMQPNVGVGLRFFKIQIDYALANLGNDDDQFSHVVSLTFDVNFDYIKNAIKNAK
ncbi:MAG: PorV/PorQ family protein [Bacteroidota bacterium]